LRKIPFSITTTLLSSLQDSFLFLSHSPLSLTSFSVVSRENPQPQPLLRSFPRPPIASCSVPASAFQLPGISSPNGILHCAIFRESGDFRETERSRHDYTIAAVTGIRRGGGERNGR